MALSIRNPGTEAAIRALARTTGTSMTEAIDTAVRAQLARLQHGDAADGDHTARARIAARIERMDATLDALRRRPLRGPRDNDELYDERGLPR